MDADHLSTGIKVENEFIPDFEAVAMRPFSVLSIRDLALIDRETWLCRHSFRIYGSL